MIAAGIKDLENRRWRTNVRGAVLLHAGRAWGQEQDTDLETLQVDFPDIDWARARFDRGGIIGLAELVDCVSYSSSPWFVGPHAFVFRNARFVEPFAYRGQLGFFDVPEIQGPEDPLLFDPTLRGRRSERHALAPSPQ